MKILIAALLSATSSFAAFTIEQVLSSPFPSDLRASPKGDAVAWVLNARGVRNIWIARAPGFEANQITRFHDDDGQDVSQLAWKPDGTALAFTRGESANGRGEFSNPRSNPAGVQQEVWLAPLAGEPRKISEGNSAEFSKDGMTIAWLRGGQIWSASSDGSKGASQMVHARGRADELSWSPDGLKLAFRSDRGDHAFIGVYTPAERNLLFLDPSVDRDQSAAWSPDSKQLAFIRVPTSRTASIWGPKPTGEPWSIRMADVSSGHGKEIWHAAEGMGSRFWAMTAENQLLWTSVGRIVFPWERDGWQHLYSTSIKDGGATLLTPGAFEIEHAALDPDGKSVVFSSGQDDIDRRHLWRVPVSGGAPVRITKGSGVEYAPALLASHQVALLRSDAKIPARAALLEPSGVMRDLAPSTMPPDFPVNSLVEPQSVMISSADGTRIHGQLFLPPASSPNSKHPAVIFFHGGSRRQMLLGWHYMFYYHQAYGFNQYLASKGYVVLSVNYRSGIGYGSSFREAPNYGATGASEYNDVIGAGLFLRNRMDVDPARIGLWGGSYGGYLTALGLARGSDMFAAGVDLHGVHDWNLELGTVYAPAEEPEKRNDFARTAYLSSPMSSITKWKSPVLLIQGDDDRNVVFSQTVQLAEALRKQGVPMEQLIFPDEVHDFLVFEHWLKAYTAADNFFGRYLKP